MKGTASALFGVAMRHCSLKGCDAHYRGVMLVTGVVTLITPSYMCKNGGEVPGQLECLLSELETG